MQKNILLFFGLHLFNTQSGLSMKQVCDAVCQQLQAFVLAYHISENESKSGMQLCAMHYADLLMTYPNGRECMAFAMFHIKCLDRICQIVNIPKS